MSDETLKRILLTTGYTSQTDKEAVFDYIQELKEQVNYLRRSIERKEETIIELEQERIPYTNEYVEELNQKYLNAVSDYEQEKFNVEELRKQIENTINENNILDTKINEYIEQKQEWINLLDMFKNQQKEFIEYLENEIKRLEEIDESKISQCSITTIRCMKSNYKEILSRYKETIGIIGDKDEKDNNNI